MKEFLKNNAGAIIVVVVIAIVVWYFFLRKKKTESSYRGIAPFRRRLDFNPPPPQGYVSKWVSSTEGGKHYCRWYDKNGNNTSTYDRPCTPAQANM